MALVQIDRFMRTESWSLKQGKRKRTLEVGLYGLSYTEEEGSSMSGTSCTYDEFLEGAFVDLIREFFGEDTLKQVTDLAKHNAKVERKRGR